MQRATKSRAIKINQPQKGVYFYTWKIKIQKRQCKSFIIANLDCNKNFQIIEMEIKAIVKLN